MAGTGTALSAEVLQSRWSSRETAIEEVCAVARRSIEAHSMLGQDDHVLAAFSGGADSTALAVTLLRLGYRVTLVHIDHGMRPDSCVDAFHCERTARRLGLQIHIVRVQVHPPTEARARKVRYEALEDVRRETGAARIATGHTLNDDAETVKMRLLRGGFGLGIPPVRGSIIRPLLEADRRQAEAVCREAGVLFLHDPSNDDIRITRNRIRQELRSSPPGEVGRLLSLGRQARARKTAVESSAARYLPPLSPELPLRVKRDALLAAPVPVAKNVIRRMLGAAEIEPSERLVADILAKVVPQPGSSLDLPGGLAVWSENDGDSWPKRFTQIRGSGWVLVGERPVPAPFPDLPQTRIDVPGLTALPEWKLQIGVFVEPWGAQEPGGLGQIVHPRDPCRLEELLDAGEFCGPTTIRQWRPGDRFFPLGSGTRNGRKLQDFFVDLKVPKTVRHSTPLLICAGRIVWVVGHRIDDRFKVTARTRNVARVVVSPLDFGCP